MKSAEEVVKELFIGDVKACVCEFNVGCAYHRTIKILKAHAQEARAEALEEAAKVAEDTMEWCREKYPEHPEQWIRAEQIACAIRALAEKKDGK